MYDFYDDYENELYHAGVKGMKWGVRRYQNADGSLTQAGRARYGTEQYYRNKSDRAAARVTTSKTRLGKATSNYSAYRNEKRANTIAAVKNEKSVLKNIDNLAGHGRLAADQKAAANYYDRKAGYVKTKLGKSIAEANAYTNRSYAKSNEKTHNSRSITEFGENFIDGVANTKVKTWSGRTTTSGKQVVDQMLTGGTLGTLQDIGYYVRK